MSSGKTKDRAAETRLSLTSEWNWERTQRCAAVKRPMRRRDCEATATATATATAAQQAAGTAQPKPNAGEQAQRTT